MDIFKMLLKDANYAIASLSRDLVYEAYGKAKMAFHLEAITFEQFMKLNTILVVNGLNNPSQCKLE